MMSRNAAAAEINNGKLDDQDFRRIMWSEDGLHVICGRIRLGKKQFQSNPAFA